MSFWIISHHFASFHIILYHFISLCIISYHFAFQVTKSVPNNLENLQLDSNSNYYGKSPKMLETSKKFGKFQKIWIIPKNLEKSKKFGKFQRVWKIPKSYPIINSMGLDYFVSITLEIIIYLSHFKYQFVNHFASFPFSSSRISILWVLFFQIGNAFSRKIN